MFTLYILPLLQRSHQPYLCIHPILTLVLKFRSGRISFLAFVTIHQQPFPLYDYYGTGGLTRVKFLNTCPDVINKCTP